MTEVKRHQAHNQEAEVHVNALSDVGRPVRKDLFPRDALFCLIDEPHKMLFEQTEKQTVGSHDSGPFTLLKSPQQPSQSITAVSLSL